MSKQDVLIEEEVQSLLEWYAGYMNKSSTPEPQTGAEEIVQADLTNGGTPEQSPQDVIQKELLKALKMDNQKIGADDNVIAMDKAKIYKSLGLMKALERILILLDDSINPYDDNPLEQQNLVDKAKKISNSISEVISSL